MQLGSLRRKCGLVTLAAVLLGLSLPLKNSLGFSLADASGEKLEFKLPPRRIVSLNPDFTENLFALGAGDRVAGVTNCCDYPPPALEKEKIRDLWSPNLEKIVSLEPDLVLATMEGNSPQAVKALRALGLKVFVSAPARDFADYFLFLSRLGRILDQKEKADALTDRFREKISCLQNRSRHCRLTKVFFQLGAKPIVSANRDTLIHQIITVAGGINLAAEAPLRYPPFSREKIIADNPEVVIIAAMGEEARAGIEEWKKFPELNAVKNNRVQVIDPDLVCRLGPRLLEGLERVAAIIHPDWADEKVPKPEF